MDRPPGSRVVVPVPRRITLSYFSLYRNRDIIDVAFEDGVFCLVGANGLGKSTFLATLNFAITGVVADPDRKFDSLSEYYRYAMPYARSYFAGRINPTEQDVASVRLEMQVGRRTYVLERAFFEPESLRFLEISEDGNTVLANDSAESDAERNLAFKQQITGDCGLAQFEQLVFLQHFVLTFDERRRLLLWDERTIEQALLLAFGVDPATAQQADDWRRKAERLDSQARNLQYQATTARGRIQDLRTRTAGSEADAVDSDAHAERDRHREALSARVLRLDRDLSALQVALAAAEAGLVEAEQAYEGAFALTMRPRPHSHPIVQESLRSDVCAVCGTAGATARIGVAVEDGRCPLCGETTADSDALDPEELDTANLHVRTQREQVDALRVRANELRQERVAVAQELGSFEDSATESVDVGLDSRAPIPEVLAGALIAQYEREAADATRRRTEFREKRDELRRRLEPISRELARRYADAEAAFVPRFVSLAHRFLGLDVSVYLQQRAGRPELVVAVGGSERRSYDQLSESQRYFLDIALRMAVAQHMSEGAGPACLYVDTPEGSLDISYEARAGMMFADFARDGNQLVMTANINTSRLLQALATACGPDRMSIVRMMEWTQLSDVQTEGEELFDEALAELNAALQRSTERA